MRRLLLAAVVLFIPLGDLHAHGVCFPDARLDYYLELVESDVSAEVRNQVAIVTITERFLNTYGEPFPLTYAFPMYGNASATKLSWRIGEEWEDAILGPAEQAEEIPGQDQMASALFHYLGETPLLFHCSACTVPEDATFEVRLTYVQLLPYSFGNVEFFFPNDYGGIQQTPLATQRFHFDLMSPRAIEGIELLSHDVYEADTGDHHADILYEATNVSPDQDFHVRYSLSLSELGLFGMSTLFPPEDTPDDLGGFFTFVVEPEPDTSTVVEKVFTLIIDKSGSMLDQNKFEQAIAGSKFVVENLNPGDSFNVVDFGTEATSFYDAHVPFTSETQASALAYIDQIVCVYENATNISGAFDLAVPQFDVATDSTANIIIFFTDGRPHLGIEDVDSLLTHVHDLIESTETDIYLYTMGIGSFVYPHLITPLATQNGGFAVYLGDGEIEEVISDFYLELRNPVLLNTSLSFTPTGIVTETYPTPLPNLYLGSQMIVSGRYAAPTTVTLRFDGQAFGQPVTYEYELALPDSSVSGYQFLPKLWAKAKIEHLLMEYDALDPYSPEAEAIVEQIIWLSISYGVSSPFTSFLGEGGDDVPIDPGAEGQDVQVSIPGPYRLLGSHPNPFNPTTTISFVVAVDIERTAVVRIYDLAGRLVAVLDVRIAGPGVYSATWDGTSVGGEALPSGVYLYAVDLGDATLTGKMVMVE